MARQATKNAAQVAQKWSTNLQASVPSIQQGVNAVTTAPTQLAAANANGFLMGVQAAVQSGKWQSALNAVSLTDWKNAMLNKGVQRVQSGATQGMPKMQAAMSKLLPYIYQVRDQINQTQPRGGLQANLSRANAFATAMSQYKGT